MVNGVRAQNCTLKILIEWAYGVHHVGDHPVLNLPKWGASIPYDLDAKVTSSAAVSRLVTDQQVQKLELMLQALLADRFRLAIHKKPIAIPMYELVVSKNGTKITEGKPRDPTLPKGAIRIIAPGTLTGEGVSIAQLAAALERYVGRGVSDGTGLTGTYNFSLDWLPEQNPDETIPGGGTGQQGPLAPSEPSKPSIFAALEEQLGLKLKSSAGPGEALVIDHVERPSPN